MIAVLFEVWLDPQQKERYLDIAAALGAELVQLDGLFFIERFQSLTDPDKLLSMSYWRDEDAVAN